ncbi:type I restriction endonuclease [uncultured Sphingomonas sp.]|uniref:type I restriction endonuclease n=1 Tax=uncultured Sphingomonas sp. TaxID=158754 RepID=UPI0025FB6F12|nr:type I restriction endonuclease [uncultured Sphingomonas sp.]
MDFATRLAELQKRTVEHREVLLTEEAAKTALVMPFLQSLGYDVFNPKEVVPEFTADVGIKKGEKVDYAICEDGRINILIECKPAAAELNVAHASQLFRYFSATDARLAILTNGVSYQFFSDVEKPNKMDERPFFTFSMEAIKPSDIRTLEKFGKVNFDIQKIIEEAGHLKLQSLLRKAIEQEFAEPTDDFVRMFAARVVEGRLTPAVKETIARMVPSTIAAIIRDKVSERLSSALNATTPAIVEPDDIDPAAPGEAIITTQEELSGYHIVQAIASRFVDPKRVVIRDSKSYCAILLDDNNRKTIARMWFNSPTTRYFGTFVGKEETKHLVTELTGIYQLMPHIETRLRELDDTIPA